VFGRDYSLACQNHSIKWASNGNSRNELAKKTQFYTWQTATTSPTGLIVKIWNSSFWSRSKRWLADFQNIVASFRILWVTFNTMFHNECNIHSQLLPLAEYIPIAETSLWSRRQMKIFLFVRTVTFFKTHFLRIKRAIKICLVIMFFNSGLNIYW